MRTISILALTAAAASAGPTKPKTQLWRHTASSAARSLLGADVVEDKVIKTYGPGIKSCYAKLVAKAPAVKGTLTVAFDVTKRGTTSSVSITSFNPSLDTCVAKLARGWRFRVPRDRDGAAVTESFVVELRLTAAVSDAEAFVEVLGDGDKSQNLAARRPAASVGGPGPGPQSSTPTSAPAAATQPDDVSAKIHSAYMAGLRRCYRNRLEQQPAASGNLVLSFEVRQNGSAIAISTRGVDAILGACVKKQVSGWRFTPIKDENGDSATSTFELPLTMTM